MALSKVDTTVYTAQSLSPSAGSTTSSWENIDNSYGTQVQVKITNGTTITVGTRWKLQGSSKSGGVEGDLTPLFQCSTTNSEVASWSIEVPIGVEFIRLVITHATYSGTASTIDYEYSKVTSI